MVYGGEGDYADAGGEDTGTGIAVAFSAGVDNDSSAEGVAVGSGAVSGGAR